MGGPGRCRLGEWKGQEIRLLTSAIIQVARDLARGLPPPPGAPFYGMDSPDGDLAPLDEFCRSGIFRKYESVLDLGSGLGVAARWWSGHFGCRVTGVDVSPALAVAATSLSARARAQAATMFLAADAARMPFGEQRFTHVWAVEGLRDLVPDDPRLREAFRLLRVGGHVGLQLSSAPAAWAGCGAEGLRAAGFTGVEVRALEKGPIPESWRLARDRLLRHLDARGDPAAQRITVELGEVYRAGDAAHRVTTYILARRP